MKTFTKDKFEIGYKKYVIGKSYWIPVCRVQTEQGAKDAIDVLTQQHPGIKFRAKAL